LQQKKEVARMLVSKLVEVSDVSCLAWFACVLLCGLSRERPAEVAELRVERDLHAHTDRNTNLFLHVSITIQHFI